MKLLFSLLLVLLISGLSVSAQTVVEYNQQQLKRAQELINSGHRSEALVELYKVANSNGFDPAGFYNLGNAFARLGESEAAISAYRRAIEQRKGRYSKAQNNLGVVLLREGRWDEAYDAFNSALKIEGFRYAEASYNLGRLYAARGQSDLAGREWRRALVVDPEHSAAAQALARGDNEQEIVVEKTAVATSSKPITVKPSSAPPSTPSRSVPSAHTASPRSSRTLTLDQTSFTFLQRAREASERGKMLEAVENFRSVINRQGGYFAPVNLELSFALLSLKRYDEALAQLLQVSKRDGVRYPVSYFHLARLYELKGELKLAEAAFEQVVAAHGSTNSQFLLDLSRVREKQGDFKGALEAMERYVALAEQQGQKPAWCDERLTALRAKAK